MLDFRMTDVFRLTVKTMPFLVFRFLIYFGITLAYAVATGAGAGTGYLIGRIGADPGSYSFFGGLVGFGIVSAALYFLREYLLYLIKAGHIAVLVEIMGGKDLPGRRGQIEYAQKMVRERFAESSVLFGVDQMIKGVLKAFNAAFFSITSFLPIPGVEGVFIWGITFLTFLVILAPVAALVSIFPGIGGPLTVIIAMVIAWGVKQAVIEPIGMTALMLVFFKVTEGQEPNPEWDARLDTLSNKFGDLKAKARDWVQGEKPGQQMQPVKI